MKGQRGFTLIEVIVVASIIAILAGILVPMIFNQIDEAKIARAQADCKSISTAILLFRKDLGKWPNAFPDDCSQSYLTLQGSGVAPANPTDDWQIGLNDVDLSIILNLPANQACYNNSKALKSKRDMPYPRIAIVENSGGASDDVPPVL